MDSAQPGASPVENNRAEWTVPVLDAVRRDPDKPLDLIVAVSETSVVIPTPSTAGVVIPHASIARLCDALRAADSVAEHRKTLARIDAEQ